MDPLSLTVSILALLEVANKFSDTCSRYIRQVRSAAQDIERIVREISLLKDILFDLQDLAEEAGNEDEKDGPKKTNLQRLASEDGSLMASYNALLEPLDKLTPKTEGRFKLKQKLMWPFESKNIDKLVGVLEKQRNIISLALLADNARAITNINEGVARIEDSIKTEEMRKRRETILAWLGQIDSSRKHFELRGPHGKGTNKWILESDQFRKWIERCGQTLWLNGIPGAGKSVACSTLVERLVKVCKDDPSCRLAYYYFDFADLSTLKLDSLFRSLLYQYRTELQH